MEEKQVQDLAAVLPVDAAQVARFHRILQKYKTGKANLERRIIENEQWWKLRHNDAAAPNDAVSAWLCNVIMSKHARLPHLLTAGPGAIGRRPGRVPGGDFAGRPAAVPV